jgi:F0F1-type ATP synthase membrane subunit c/vacuolar-type H+-ATPase subunit K
MSFPSTNFLNCIKFGSFNIASLFGCDILFANLSPNGTGSAGGVGVGILSSSGLSSGSKNPELQCVARRGSY